VFDWVSVNWLAVVAAALVGLLIGIIWYAPPVFGGIAKRTGIGLPSARPAAAAASTGIVLLTAYVLALFERATGAASLVDGAIVGGTSWLGFMLTAALSNALFEKRSAAYVAITSGQLLLSLLAMGAMIGSWR
jgi:hypothetical protein